MIIRLTHHSANTFQVGSDEQKAALQAARRKEQVWAASAIEHGIIIIQSHHTHTLFVCLDMGRKMSRDVCAER